MVRWVYEYLVRGLDGVGSLGGVGTGLAGGRWLKTWMLGMIEAMHARDRCVTASTVFGGSAGLEPQDRVLFYRLIY